MSLRRGFKTEANAYARELRIDMGLAPSAPLSPWKLANHLDIPVLKLSELSGRIPQEVQYLLQAGREFFSAVTVSVGYRRSILHNDGNAITRQASDIAHELAHAILGHPPSPPFNDAGLRVVNKSIEEEAQWLGFALLVSEEAALEVARSGASLSFASRQYGVSQLLMRMRLNVTGAVRRAG